ncbi:MAG: NACHT domain-containing protein [Caldilinea sp. CFX5]|nr:NACHT domain-containing protein [Caldilinea sp. CFX5]
MALLTTIALTIGGALVKHVAAGYLGDGPKSQVAQDLLDLVRDQIGDGLTSRPEQPSIEQVAQQVTQKLLPIFAQESRNLDPATREAIVLAVAQTLATSKIDADLFFQRPGRLRRDADFAAERPQRVVGSIQEILTYAPRLVIQGQPGSGKSTMLRWLAIQLALRTLSQEQPALASWDDCIPFYLQLRTFANKALPTPSEWPTLQVRQLALKPPDRWMHEVLSDGRAVVLIDGVDETPEGQRAELLQWLQEVMNAYPWARYIITSRPAAIKLWPEWIDWSRSSGFLTLSLQEMELEQCFHFINQWHDALQQSLPDAAQREEVAALAEPLKQLVRQRDALRRLARNPLLCSMICALHREHPHTMPQNRIKLYQNCVEMLMHRRDAERKVGSLADYPPLSNIYEEVILRDYAHHLMLNGESEEDLRDADHYFDELLQRVNLPGWTGERLRHYFVARTGLLFEPAEGRIAFAHRTFQEFLAAREIVKKNEIRMLINKARDDQWRETILLTIGIPEIDPKQSDRLLNGLLNRADELTTARYRHELYLLVVACLETAIYLTPPMRRHILAKAAALLPPRNNDAVALIAKGGDPMVGLLRFDPRYSLKKWPAVWPRLSPLAVMLP